MASLFYTMGMYNTAQYNTGSNILTVDLTETVVETDANANTPHLVKVETVSSIDVVSFVSTKNLIDTIFYSDSTIAILQPHKILTETIRANDWLSLQKDRRNGNPSSWTGA